MNIQDVEDRLKSLGLILPPAPTPVGSYRPVILTEKVAYISGQVSKDSSGKIFTGRLGQLTVAEGQKAAALAALNVLSIIKNLVRFERFKRMLRVIGYVQSEKDFQDIPQVVNGASDLFIQILGESGAHSRSSVGVYSLPMGAAVEIEATIELA